MPNYVRAHLAVHWLASLLAVAVLLAACINKSAPRYPIKPPDRSDTEQEQEDRKHTERLLGTALADERAYMQNLELSGTAWGTAAQMRQLAGKGYFVDREVPRGGETVSVVVTGDPNDHPDDVLYLGARVAQRDICIYARDVIERASASMTPGLVWAVSMPCVRPDEPASWRDVTSPLELFVTEKRGTR
jgi:hypothetical protein